MMDYNLTHNPRLLVYLRKFLQYTFRANVLKSTSSSYVQILIENMVLTSYLDKSYFAAS